MLNQRDIRHDRRDQLHITAQPWKRDDTGCPTDYFLCPASANGGCCPAGRSCGQSSCYATTAAPQTECSKSGYIACGLDQGGEKEPGETLGFIANRSIGGCCPDGYSCTNNGCLPLSGSSYGQTCGPSSYLCPPSLGNGCCHTNYACGNGVCHRTSFSTVNITLTTTSIDANSNTITIVTTIQTAYSDPALAQTLAAPASTPLAQITPTPTAVPKVDPTSSPTTGLTQAQLDGIIAAAVVLSIVVIIATFLIIRRLNTVAKEHKATAKSGSGSRTRSSSRPHQPRLPPSSAVDYDNMSIDPLMVADSSSNASVSVGVPRPSAVHSIRSELDHTSSPPIPAPYTSLHGYSGDGYQQVPTNEGHYYDSVGHYRNYSGDSAEHPVSPPISSTPASYFDPYASVSRDPTIRFGPALARPNRSVHGRQRSDSSDASQQSGSTDVAELDAGVDGDRRKNLPNVMKGTGLSRTGHKRRHSEEGRRKRSGSSSAASARLETGTATGMGQLLENVPESEMDTRQKPEGSRSRGPGIAKSPTSPLDADLERREGQKVMGLGDEVLVKGKQDKMLRERK
jgi:hypothetical protein